MQYVVVITAPDGTVSVAGLWHSKAYAEDWALLHERIDNGWECTAHAVEPYTPLHPGLH